MTTPRIGISVIVPVYNGAPLIGELVERVRQVLEQHATEFELILVNDHSADNSWQVIEAVAENFSFVTGVNLAKNSGQHNALLCGIRLARYPICVTLDDDLQFIPEEIPQLLEKLDNGFDLVYGTPQKQKHGLWRNFASLTTKLAVNALMGSEMARHISPFRAFKTKLRDAFKDAVVDITLVDVLLSWSTSRY
ncbi:MAG: glycosyltransferase family 2 protein, partial [Candidatus Melainabacteria bacterium]|nr:glycosyltransferase family 2 protein [Candidatus Melainabacteria bacterium]